jgi:hypothetical protein
MVLKENLKPPDPSDMMQEVSTTTTNGDGQVNTITGLRMSTGDSYLDFCENFMPCICTDEEWKRHSKNSRASEFIMPTLEAFGIVTYLNGYEVWKNRFKTPDEDVSGMTTEGTSEDDNSGDTRYFKFTGNARGSKKYAGWSPTGMQLYNKIAEELVEQRRNEDSGIKFDDRLLERLSTKRKRTTGYGESHATPRATNNLEKLLTA